ncbi:MAG: channel protein TolC [Betaproteobacteria bacterium]|nr:channel protein TolC [Betaproteobacteria bacterium]
MRKTLLAFVLSAVLPLAWGDDLLKIYRDSVKADPAYAGIRAQVEAARERVVQGRSTLLPQINLGGNTKWNDVDVKSDNTTLISNNSQSFTSWQAGINASHPLYRPQNSATYTQSKAGLQQAEAQLALSGQQLMVRVSEAYFAVLLAQDTVEYLKSQEAAISEQLAQAKRNFEVGNATITDTYDAQARADLVRAQQVRAKNDFEVKMRALQQIIGRLPARLSVLVDPISLSLPEPNDIDRWVEQAYKSSWEVFVQKSVLEQSEAELTKTRGGRNPTVDAVSGLNYDATNNISFGVGTDTRTFFVGVELGYPLYTGGNLSAKVREAIANRSKAEQDYELTRRQVAQSTREAFLGVVSGLAEIKALDQALASNKLSLDATKLGKGVGVRTQVDVLNAQERLFSARRDLQRARYSAIVNQLKLKQAVGKLTERDIEVLNTLLREQKS